MMVRAVVGLGLMGAIVAVLSCRDAQPGAGGECPIGTFRPAGITDCVIPADGPSGGNILDNRCALTAQAPTCVSASGLRPYFATSMHCASGYQYRVGGCVSGGAGFGGTGFGTGVGGGTGGFMGATDGVGFADGTGFGVDGVGFVDGHAMGVAGMDGSLGGFSGGDGMPNPPTDARLDEAPEASPGDAASDAAVDQSHDRSDVGE